MPAAARIRNTPAKSTGELRVSAYDRVSSWLAALLVVSSVVVGALLSIYFARRMPTGEVAVPVQPVTLHGGGGGGEGGQLGAGGDQSLPAFTGSEAADEPQLEDTLETIASAVTQSEPVLFDDTIDSDSAPAQEYLDTRKPGTTGTGGGVGTGRGPGTGSGIGPGSGGGMGGGVYRLDPDREIRFEPQNLLEYARFLDYFGIELGVLGRDNKIHYAYNLSQEAPSIRVGEPAEELRFYMNSARGRFAALDRRLAIRSGIADEGRIILQFYPEKAYALLQQLENERAAMAGKQPEDVRRTVYRVTRTGNQFQLEVLEQTYRL
ncbi:MAG: hypothetical protein AB7G28_16030 [Pirellulales bacterium]